MIFMLLVGDYILVNKYVYGLCVFILGMEIILIGKLKIGDIMVFKYFENFSINYIKCVVGVLGDEICYENKIIYVNGVVVFQILEVQLLLS